MMFQPWTAATPFELAILLLPKFSLLSMAATLEPLRAANRVAGRELYRWRLLSADGRAVPTSSGIALPVEGALEASLDCHALVVIASFEVDRHVRPVLARLRRLARRGIALGGVEAGSWVLAHAGLLDGRRATTHWEDLEEFANAFPAVEVVPDRFVAGRDRFTTGGATPALDMMLELIRCQHGTTIALDVASVFIYGEPTPAAEPQRIVSVGPILAAEPRVARAIRLMEERIGQPLPVAAIARRLGLSVRSLEVKFRRHLGVTPRDYYLDLRLSAARRMLSHPGHSITGIADAAGFASASAFARAFRARFGQSPSQARGGLMGTRVA